jgi:hypothetical protein
MREEIPRKKEKEKKFLCYLFLRILINKSINLDFSDLRLFKFVIAFPNVIATLLVNSYPL